MLGVCYVVLFKAGSHRTCISPAHLGWLGRDVRESLSVSWAQGLEECMTARGLYWLLEIGTQLLMLAHMLPLLSHPLLSTCRTAFKWLSRFFSVSWCFYISADTIMM